MEPAPRREIVRKVTDVIAEVLRIDADTITIESQFEQDLGADSLDRVTLLMNLEDAFGAEISDDEAAGFTTVGDVVAFVAGRMARNEA